MDKLAALHCTTSAWVCHEHEGHLYYKPSFTGTLNTQSPISKAANQKHPLVWKFRNTPPSVYAFQTQCHNLIMTDAGSNPHCITLKRAFSTGDSPGAQCVRLLSEDTQGCSFSLWPHYSVFFFNLLSYFLKTKQKHKLI